MVRADLQVGGRRQVSVEQLAARGGEDRMKLTGARALVAGNELLFFERGKPLAHYVCGRACECGELVECQFAVSILMKRQENIPARLVH